MTEGKATPIQGEETETPGRRLVLQPKGQPAPGGDRGRCQTVRRIPWNMHGPSKATHVQQQPQRTLRGTAWPTVASHLKALLRGRSTEI